jgi:iron complex outermembrane receptor protein
MYEWRGYDASGNSIYADAAGNDTSLGTAAKSILDKQPIPKLIWVSIQTLPIKL